MTTIVVVGNFKFGECSKGECAMSIVLEFASCLVKNLVGVSEEAMDYWVKNPKALQETLTNALSRTRNSRGWKVESHKEEAFQEDPSKITLYLSEGQKEDRNVQGLKLQKELEGQPVLNANTLNYLLAHPYLIPEEWKGEEVFFWGTTYRHPDGPLCVRYLFWFNDLWVSGYKFFDNNFNEYGPAACSQV